MLTLNYGLLSGGSVPLDIIDTDYENYAVSYSCSYWMNIGFIRYEKI